MLCAKVIKKDAEKIKQYLIKHKLFDDRYRLIVDNEFVYYPVIKEFHLKGVCFVKRDNSVLSKKITTLKEALAGKVSSDEMKALKTSFDTVGTIAIIEIPELLIKKEKFIGEALLSLHPSLKTVVKKIGIHGGEFRTQKVKIIAGKRTKETLYVENSVRLKFNIEKVYFSVRLASERKRIYQQVKKGERILVMFSGCGVYPLVLAKNTVASEIVGIEKNPIAHNYGIENVVLNKTSNVKLFLGDVRKIIPTLTGKFDRILMPLPKNAGDFIDLAFLVAQKQTIIHLYDFIHEDETVQLKKKIFDLAAKLGKKIKIKEIVFCGQYSPHHYRVCVDIMVF